ncbi:pleckstrin homology-like domain family A member 2 [Leucoraja erinacea]|uniref:pleckstrin homology-like domain family A member 2 n=1 Tax=Leucoraja erinaceus TaxID=7782 RepID=UPI002456FD8B|nr:pleckstrin homology-like domain family A member 2 [Leucoraja erinacea]
MKGLSVCCRDAIKVGELEKRSESLLQLWKRKHCTLTRESLVLEDRGSGSGSGRGSKAGSGRHKELGFATILKLECVERKGARVYFTIVTTDRREIDFRCRDDSSWNAAITVALVAFKNEQAVRESHARKPAKRWRGWAA